jgi:hypothetical protein
MAKELRRQLKDVPLPCRAMFIKMFDLKNKTKQLATNMEQKRAEIRMQ